MVLALAPAGWAAPLGCTGSTTLGTFQLMVRPFSEGAPLPLKSVAEIPGGSRLIWDPVHLMLPGSKDAEVAAVLVPPSNGEGDLLTLEPRKAHQRTEWQLPERPRVIAVIYGPQGLSEGKIKSLVTHNPDLLKQLADYAEQSSQVESLVQQLANAEQNGGSANAVLKGFSSQYGVALPTVDTKAPSNQQASALLGALLPASNAYDPLSARTVQVQQTGGLAAAMAGMFFGNPVALAAGGASLFENLRTAIFPGTQFRSAFTQADDDGMALCTKSAEPQAKMKSAYLWAYRAPEFKKPVISLAGTPHVPVGSKSSVAIDLGDGSALRDLAFARDWKLIGAGDNPAVPVSVQFDSPEKMTVDLSKAKVHPGEYQLAATWDWAPVQAAGKIDVRAYSDFSHVTLANGERDKLVEGSGSQSVTLTGADFEFLEKAGIESSGRGAPATDVSFALPQGKRAGPQNSVQVNIETSKQGSYHLLLTQSDGVAHAIPLTILPPNPKISNLPVRLNAGEMREAIHLEGSGLERIEAISSDAGTVTGKPGPHGWSGKVALKSGLTKGETFALSLKVQGLEKSLDVPDAIEIEGPRPKIRSVQKSLAGDPGVQIANDELPAGTAAGLVLTVDHIDDAGQPSLQLGCANGNLRNALTLSPGEPSGGASLSSAGPGALYLSVDPGTVGYAGCTLTATVSMDSEGHSDPFVLGHVVRIPQLEKFALTSEKVGDSSYAGTLQGRDLDVIEMTGWDAAHGVPVESIPTPVSGDPTQQTLRVVLPWPAPAPHAPLYVWLRGETKGRKTAVTD